MLFRDDATKLGLIQDCEIRIFGDSGYGQITGNTDRLYQFTARINRAQDRFAYLAMTADGRWQWDDANNTDYAIAVTDLVSGQRDYTFAVGHLEIEKILIKDTSGNWVLLDQTIDTSDFKNMDVKRYLENNSGNSGQPIRYDKLANAVFFDPVPNYSQTGGIKIYFKRGPNYFVYTDTTKVPGFASIFHDYLSKYASWTYAVDRGLDSAQSLETQVALEEVAIKDFFSSRNKDERSRLKVNWIESNK